MELFLKQQTKHVIPVTSLIRPLLWKFLYMVQGWFFYIIVQILYIKATRQSNTILLTLQYLPSFYLDKNCETNKNEDILL